jgi:hypothetical protein
MAIPTDSKESVLVDCNNVEKWRYILLKLTNIKFHENPFGDPRVVSYMRLYGQADMV